MVDITEISAIVAAAGVLVGVAYYILDMRNQKRTRETDLAMRLWQQSCSEENVRAASRLASCKISGFR